MPKKFFTKIKDEKGFTLLFAVIVSTLVLAVGGSIINIALKQVILSGTGRESQYAFYAANTGIECAYYWDIAGVGDAPAFATSSSGFDVPGIAACAGTADIYDDASTDTEARLFDTKDLGDGVTQSYFRLQNFVNPEGEDLEYCADVYVRKTIGGSGQVTSTEIESRGYNTCDDANPRRIERGLEMRY
jgi:hypothetical protein